MTITFLHGDCIKPKEENMSNDDYINELRNIMSKVMKVKCISMNSTDFEEFHSYYELKQSGKKIKSD